MLRQRAATGLRGGIELLVLLLVCVSPWALGGVEPGAEFCLYCGVAVLLLLWAGRALLLGSLTWNHCPAALGLAGLFLFGVFQLTPLPEPILRTLSPATARLYGDLLPAQPEVLSDGEARPAVPSPVGSTISLHPAATRTELVRLLAVFLLFAVVRNNAASPASLRRLAFVCLVNGFLLSLFALIQFFSSPPATVYWTFPVVNNPFGPFICKNHFPFYLNLCIGLGVGLLLSLRKGGGVSQHGTEADGETWGEWLSNPLEILQSPGLVWISLALALMVAAVAFALSRGGFISLVGALFVTLVFRFARFGGASRPELVVLIATVAVGLIGWFGMDPIKERYASLWKGEAFEDVRGPLWWNVLASVKHFPLWGTGYGTFLHVELTYRTRIDDPNMGWDNAHNDYVEALVEGGVVRLVLSLVVIGLVYRLGWRALHHLRGRSAQGLVFGALFAFTTAVIHSFVDFGLHIPAIAILVTVLSAHLAALGARQSVPGGEEADDPVPENASTFRLGGLAPLAGLVAALALGGILCAEGWRQVRTYSLEVSARQEAGSSAPDAQERRLEILERAVSVSPRSAPLHLLAGQASLDLYQAKGNEAETREKACDIAGLVLAAPTENALPLQGAFARLAPDPLPAKQEKERLVRQYLLPALRHYLQARDLCPLIAKSHIQIAAHREWLARSDPRTVYLARAKQACPSSAELWYLAGAIELADGRPQDAWASWRRSLERSPQFLAPILKRSRITLNDDELIDEVLPDRADLLLAAAEQMYPRAEETEQRPFLLKARALLANQSQPLEAADLHRRARIEAALGDNSAALASYKSALMRSPNEMAWRVEYARLLHQEKQFAAARRELLTVLASAPEHPEATQLLEQVARALAEGN